MAREFDDVNKIYKIIGCVNFYNRTTCFILFDFIVSAAFEAQRRQSARLCSRGCRRCCCIGVTRAGRSIVRTAEERQ